MRTPLIAGNFKMNMDIASARNYARKFKELVDTKYDVLVCAPYLQLETLISEFYGKVMVGAQNVHFEDSGAFTGEISAPMLKEIGVSHCIVGHSERRQYFGETDEAIAKKLPKLFENGIVPILCVGESLEERNAGKEKDIVSHQVKADLVNLDEEQVKKMVIAYEPIWAIGTGLTATKEQAQEMCKLIRDTVSSLYGKAASEDILIQYGGSAKPENIKEIMSMEDIDGALVGGASLDPDKFNKMLDF
ncbi:MAG: triose-phosphate isomerase [Clostridia bacterium]|nr:triose-phosphate isomerase [Clostridia bacterium]